MGAGPPPWTPPGLPHMAGLVPGGAGVVDPEGGEGVVLCEGGGRGVMEGGGCNGELAVGGGLKGGPTGDLECAGSGEGVVLGECITPGLGICDCDHDECGDAAADTMGICR